jgi:hypothetical protein
MDPPAHNTDKPRASMGIIMIATGTMLKTRWTATSILILAGIPSDLLKLGPVRIFVSVA